MRLLSTIDEDAHSQSIRQHTCSAGTRVARSMAPASAAAAAMTPTLGPSMPLAPSESKSTALSPSVPCQYDTAHQQRLHRATPLLEISMILRGRTIPHRLPVPLIMSATLAATQQTSP